MSQELPAPTLKKARQDAAQKAKTFLFNRQKAYQETFKSDSELAKIVLQDLAKFCRAEESCFHLDQRAHAVAEGRREVWLRIRKHLDLKSEELFQYYTGEK